MQKARYSEADALEPQFDLHSNQTAFPHLNESEIAEAAAFGERCSFRKNEVLFSSGDKSFDSYTILSGQVRIMDISTGERVLLRPLWSRLLHRRY
jgi:CRP-like cAMP-binding protein